MSKCIFQDVFDNNNDLNKVNKKRYNSKVKSLLIIITIDSKLDLLHFEKLISHG